MQRRTLNPRSAENPIESQRSRFRRGAADFSITPFTVTNWISYLVLAQGVAMIFFMAYIVWYSYTPLLWVDQWGFLMEMIGNHGHYSGALLWQQHDDHRIPIPKLFYLADLYLFHGTNVFLLAVIFCIQLLHTSWLGFIYARLGRLSGAAWRTAVGLTAMCLFGFRQVENFLFGSDLPLVLPYFGATVAISSLAMYHQSLRENSLARSRILFLLVSWCAAAIASLSLTNGLLLWPILLVLALIWRLPKSSIICTAVLAVTLIGVWSIGYSNHTSKLSLSSLPLVLRYLRILYGSSWSSVNEPFGMLLATVVLPLTAVVCLWYLAKRPSDVFGVTLLSLAGFMLGSSFATALGRVSMGLQQARASRYQTGALLLWCCLGVLIIRQVTKMREKQGWLLVPQSAILGIFISVSLLAGRCIQDVHIHSEQMKRAAVAMEAGVNDAPWLLYPIVRPWMSNDMLIFGDFLKSRKWSIFAHEKHYPLGRQFTKFYRPVSSASCWGAIDEVAPLRDYRWPGFRVSGWAWDRKASAPGTSIAWVDSSGRLIGMAESGFSRPDVPAAIPAIRRRDTGYVGYIPGALESATADAYVVLADHVSACLLSGAPVKFDLAATAYVGPRPTGATRNLIRNNFPASGVVESVDGRWIAGASPLTVTNADEPLTVEGWVVDPKNQPDAAADVAVDGIPYAAQYGFDRPGVAQWLHAPGAEHSGFRATLPDLSPGKHQLTLRVIPRNQDLYHESPPITLLIK